jgi:hypothetical protein
MLGNVDNDAPCKHSVSWVVFPSLATKEYIDHKRFGVRLSSIFGFSTPYAVFQPINTTPITSLHIKKRIGIRNGLMFEIKPKRVGNILMIEKSKRKSNASHRFPPESNDYARIQTLAESSLSGENNSGGK